VQGLAVIGRGYDTRIEAPFGEPVDEAIGKVVDLCVDACPTGALVKRSDEKASRRRR
jgi:NADH dehydrogenase/NADH:ubiquinone oxidoreductase subunit G